LTQWPELAEALADAVRTPAAALDGKICCLEPDGRTNFTNLLFQRGVAALLCVRLLRTNGDDVTALPPIERKRRLRRILPTRAAGRLRSLDHLAARGCDLFRMACERDLQGIVAKWARGTYRTDGWATSWLKIKIRTTPRCAIGRSCSRHAKPRVRDAVRSNVPI